MDVWEENIKEGECALEFQAVTGKREKEEEEVKGRGVKSLIDDFPKLRVGGLLPDPTRKPEGVVIQETLEWTVVVFLRGRGRWRKVLCPDQTFQQTTT